MMGWTFSLCKEAFDSALVPAALVISSLNMLLQVFISAVFGTKGLPKIRGYRG